MLIVTRLHLPFVLFIPRCAYSLDNLKLPGPECSFELTDLYNRAVPEKKRQAVYTEMVKAKANDVHICLMYVITSVLHTKLTHWCKANIQHDCKAYKALRCIRYPATALCSCFLF